MTPLPEQTDHSSCRRNDAPLSPKAARSRAFFLFSWLAVVALLGLIFFMSAKSGDAIDTGSGIISAIRHMLINASVALFGYPLDVSPVGHFTEYFLLGLALTNALRLSLPLVKAGIWAMLLASLYGASDELHQLFVPGRSCDPADWLVDTIAALLAALIFVVIQQMRQKHEKSRTDTGVSL